MMAELHDRMPAILDPKDWPTWLASRARASTLLRPAVDDVLKVWPVSKQVNNPRDNGAELLEGLVDGLAGSALPARLSQTIEHVLIILRADPRGAAPNIEFKGSRRDLDRLT
jgi:SOS response associated peptidase (SRAP)